MMTLCNLFLGCVALVYIFDASQPLQQRLVWAAIWVFIAGALDFADGFVARWLRAASALGKQLDSLADAVTFGVVPGAVVFQLLMAGYQSTPTAFGMPLIYGLPAFLLSVFAVLRLGKFNIDTRQSEGFIGLPAPAMSVFVMALPLVWYQNPWGLGGLVLNKWLLYAITVLFSALMVAGIPMISFKFRHFRWQGNQGRYLFLLMAIFVVAALQTAGIAVAILLYIGISLIQKQLAGR